MKKKIIIIGLLLISVGIIPFVIFSLHSFVLIAGNGGGGGEYVPPEPPFTEYDIISPTLQSIIPNPSTDGNIQLYWDDAEILNSDLLNEISLSYYKVIRRKDGGAWTQIKLVFDVEFYDDYGLISGTYEYKIQAVFYKPIELHYSDYSNVQSVIVGILPSNPSIIINDGATTTNSFEITLTLYADDADEMQFRIGIDTYLNWTTYSTTYVLTLSEGYLIPNNKFRIGVVFRNEDGTTEVLGDVFAEIIYEEPTNGDGDGNGNGNGEPPPPDYTMIYILLGVLASLIGTGVFLKYRKRSN